MAIAAGAAVPRARTATATVDLCPDKSFRIKATFSERDSETPFAAIMGAFY